MACVVLAFVVAAAANARICDITSTDIFVEGCLSLFVEVADALKSHTLVRPCVSTQPGHPVAFDHNWYSKLSQLTGDNGARELLRGESVHLIEIEDADSQRDIDLPSQLVQRSE